MLLLLLALGGALQSEGGAKPTPLNQEQWVLNTDYPAEAIKGREEGTVSVRLGVDAVGRVSSCTVTQSAKSAALDAASCKLLVERARFSPARGNAGKAVASTFEARFQWEIPKDIDKLGEVLWTVDLDPDGRVAKCAMETSGQLPDMAEADLCSTFGDDRESEYMTAHGAAYRTIRIVVGLSMNDAGYPIDGSQWGTLLTRQISEMKFAEDAQSALSCTMKSSWGEDLGQNLCDVYLAENGLATAPWSKPVHAVRFELVVFGTPR
jgi:TonB family protein